MAYPQPPEDKPRYRGIDREPLHALSFDDARLFTEAGFSSVATPATQRLAEIEAKTNRADGWVTEYADLLNVWSKLGEAQSQYEIIFAKEFSDPVLVDPHFQFLGCDAAYFVHDHFSCICDALFFPRWHGTDAGVLFAPYYTALNGNGLFASNDAALDYLRYYLSLDWTERASGFTSIEIYYVPQSPDRAVG